MPRYSHVVPAALPFNPPWVIVAWHELFESVAGKVTAASSCVMGAPPPAPPLLLLQPVAITAPRTPRGFRNVDQRMPMPSAMGILLQAQGYLRKRLSIDAPTIRGRDRDSGALPRSHDFRIVRRGAPLPILIPRGSQATSRSRNR